MERLTKTFTARSKDGQEFVLHVYTNFIAVGTLSNPRAEVPGLKRLRTSDGMAVNRLDSGRYEIVQTGVVVMSDAPDAP